MPIKWLTDAERERLSHFPTEIAEADLIAFFTLTEQDLRLIRNCRGETNRLGFALQLGTLRWLGFVPDDLLKIPAAAAAFVASQLEITAVQLAHYGQRAHTRTDHLLEIEAYLG